MSGKRGRGDPTSPYKFEKRRKEDDGDSSSSDESSNSGNSTNAISPNAAPLAQPMISSSPPTGSFMGAQPPNENGNYLSSLSSDGLAGLMGNMEISGSESDSDTPPANTPPVTSAPQRRRSNTMGGKSKKRKTKYGGKKMKKTKRKWSKKYKKSINCKKPKGFSQKQYCKYGRKTNKRRTKKTRRR
jgi:hypothetical protein